MRHRIFGRQLNRDYDHRRALFKNLARAFFANQGKIKTTLAKAKAVQPLIERMITKAKRGDLVGRRWLFRYFQNQEFVNQIVDQFGRQFKERKGGYTRIVRIKRRRGDDAVIVRLELVEELKIENRKSKESGKQDKKKKEEKGKVKVSKEKREKEGKKEKKEVKRKKKEKK